MNWARATTVLLGALATLIAVLLATVNIGSLWDFFIEMSGLFTGALAGVFVLGLFTTRVGSTAAFIGVLASGTLMYFVEKHALVHGLFYAAVGVISSVIAGLAASFVFPSREKPLLGLTVFTLQGSASGVSRQSLAVSGPDHAINAQGESA